MDKFAYLKALRADDRLPAEVRLTNAEFRTLVMIFTWLLLFVFLFIPVGSVLVDSFRGADGAFSLANYQKFFSDPFQYETITKTFRIALPVTILNLLLAIPIAFRVRLMTRQRRMELGDAMAYAHRH